MTVREKAGAERSKSSMRSASGPFPWHCFPLIGSYPTSPLGLGCRVRLKEMELHRPWQDLFGARFEALLYD
jgi:hypothetical protein